MRASSSPASVLSVRVNRAERAILEAAATQLHMTLSEFVRRKALESAEADILNRSVITIPARNWRAFEAWIRRPAEKVPALAELGCRRPTWNE